MRFKRRLRRPFFDLAARDLSATIPKFQDFIAASTLFRSRVEILAALSAAPISDARERAKKV
jgi:hypothetical protein